MSVVPQMTEPCRELIVLLNNKVIYVNKAALSSIHS